MRVMSNPIFLFLMSYIGANFSLNYLLKSRVRNNLSQMPPSKSMVSLLVPWGVSLAVGIIMAAAIVPFVIALNSSHSILSASSVSGLIAVALCVLLIANSILCTITHLLLTFNIIGPYVKVLSWF
jgi:hypothetical protein